jgi:ADP-ribose pyrophosphatase
MPTLIQDPILALHSLSGESIIRCDWKDEALKPNATETLLEAAVFDVQRWTFQNTPVGAVERDIVVHPGAVVIVPLVSETEIVMVHNIRHAVGRELLELPAGTLEDGERPIDCARRELEEETGYRADAIEPLCDFYTAPGICTELMHAFVARKLSKTAQRLDRTEQIRVEMFGLDHALRMVATGRIADGKTIAALSTYSLRLGQL